MGVQVGELRIPSNKSGVSQHSAADLGVLVPLLRDFAAKAARVLELPGINTEAFSTALGSKRPYSEREVQSALDGPALRLTLHQMSKVRTASTEAKRAQVARLAAVLGRELATARTDVTIPETRVRLSVHGVAKKDSTALLNNALGLIGAWEKGNIAWLETGTSRLVLDTRFTANSTSDHLTETHCPYHPPHWSALADARSEVVLDVVFLAAALMRRNAEHVFFETFDDFLGNAAPAPMTLSAMLRDMSGRVQELELLFRTLQHVAGFPGPARRVIYETATRQLEALTQIGELIDPDVWKRAPEAEGIYATLLGQLDALPG